MSCAQAICVCDSGPVSEAFTCKHSRLAINSNYLTAVSDSLKVTADNIHYLDCIYAGLVLLPGG